MTYGEEIFELAMAHLDELDDSGKAQHDDTEDYERRAAGILTSLVAEYRLTEGKGGYFGPLEALDDAIPGVEDSYALGVMPYGLAAALIADENPTLAYFLQERYEELRDRFFRRKAAYLDAIDDLYGGIEYGEFARW